MKKRYRVTTQIKHGDPLSLEVLAPTATEAVQRAERQWSKDGYTDFVFMEAVNIERPQDCYRFPPQPQPRLWT